MMADGVAAPLLHRAVLRHLADVKGLRGVQVFVGQRGDWTEATRRGDIAPDLHRRVLAAFDPAAGGAVEALEAPQGGWLATYMMGGPGVDLVVILTLAALDPAALQSRLSSIEAKIGWLMVAAVTDRREGLEGRSLGGEIGARILLDAAAARTRRMLADQWIARLERVWSPDLVAVLWVSGGSASLAAVSGGGLIERPSDARGDLEALARAAVANRAPILVADNSASGPHPADAEAPPGADAALAGRLRAEALACLERLGAHAAAVLPVYERQDAVAVVAVLFEGDAPAAATRPEAAEVVATFLGESAAIQRRAHPRPLRRLWTWVGDGARAVFGRTAWKLKAALALLAGAIAVAAAVPSQLQPTFTARVEAVDRRIVSAPYDGFLAAADFQPGDRIPAGAMLVAMEDSDLRLRLAQVRAEAAAVEAELQTARARRDTAQVRLLEARRAQAGAQRDLLDRQIALSRFTAPSPAIVVGGDAWQRVGDRVRLGEPLLELAAADSFRVLAFVDEDWIAALSSAAAGTLLLTAYPQRPVPVVLAGIGADPAQVDGANAFPVWFEIAVPVEMDILDGMRGVLRVDVGERSALEAYSRGLRRWAARVLWRFGIGGAA